MSHIGCLIYSKHRLDALILLYVQWCFVTCIYVCHVHTGVQGGQKKASDTPKLNL